MKKLGQRNKVNAALTCIVVGLTAGCVSYQPKPGEATSRLRFVTYTSYSTLISVQDSAACPERSRLVYQTIAGLLPSVGARIGMPGSADTDSKDSIELAIPGEQPALIVARSGAGATQWTPGYTCEVGASFVPKKGADYELQYRYDNNVCGVQLMQLNPSADGKIEKVRDRTLRTFKARLGDNLCPYR